MKLTCIVVVPYIGVCISSLSTEDEVERERRERRERREKNLTEEEV